MVTAQIAYGHLNPAVKAKCDALIAVPLASSLTSSGTSNFVTAACWADDFKTQLGTAIWHYIDLPFSLDGTSTSGVGTASFDVVRAISLSVSNLAYSGTSQSNQAVSLRYLIHFTGDIQQPLHASTAVSASSPTGDAGGNGFGISGTWNNLHSLWDAGGGFLSDSTSRPLSTAARTTISNKVAMVETAYPYSPNPGTIPDPMTWALVSQGLAETVAYVGITNGSSPSTAYLNAVQATTEQRMALGGHLLADLLTTLYTTNPITLASSSISQGRFGFSWSAIPGRNYRIQWKEQLAAPTWNDLTNFIAASNTASFAESPVQTGRFYRVAQ
jgi:hypothetical protein